MAGGGFSGKNGALMAAMPGPDAAEMTRLARPAIDLTKIKAATPEQAKKLGQDFEAMFLTEMMRPMFEGVSKPNSLFGGGHGEEVYGSMMVQQYANAFAKHGGIGIAKQIEKIALKNSGLAEGATPHAGNNAAATPKSIPPKDLPKDLTAKNITSSVTSTGAVDALAAQSLAAKQQAESALVAAQSENAPGTANKKDAATPSLAEKLPKF